MAKKFLNKKTHRFYFDTTSADPPSYVLIFGDEVNTQRGNANLGPEYMKVKYRGREGEMKNPNFTSSRGMEMYFLDIGQGDAAFVVTPNNKTILVDGGLKDRALGFLIWKYRIDQGNSVEIDHLFLSHADKDHVEGLIPLLEHPEITVKNIYHNGIGIFDSGFDEKLGDLSADKKRLTTLHDQLSDLPTSGLNSAYSKWIKAVKDSGANYRRLDRSMNILDIDDSEVTCEITGPVLEPGGQSLEWFNDKSHTINGHSLTFRLTYGNVRTFFSGDLNIKGGNKILSVPNGSLSVNAHIFKAPHHGSHEYSPELFDAVNPMITVVSSGEIPDHGHPRANFLGAIGKSSRGTEPLLFSTELAALFVDDHDPVSVASTGTVTTLGDLDFSQSSANTEARIRFKKVLPGIINVRTDGQEIYAFRRVKQGYQWESYGPIQPVH